MAKRSDTAVVLPSELTRELKALRKGHGLTSSKLEQQQVVLDALKVRPTSAAHRRLVDLVKSLGSGVPARALRAAYAIDHGEHHVLKTRREVFGASIERYDQSTIIRYEDEAIRQLVLLLMDEEAKSSQEFMHCVSAIYISDKLTDVEIFPMLMGEWSAMNMGDGKALYRRSLLARAGNHHSTGGMEHRHWTHPDRRMGTLPILIYRLPDDASASFVMLDLSYDDSSHTPSFCEALSSPDLFGVLTRQSDIPIATEFFSSNTQALECKPPRAVRYSDRMYMGIWKDVRPGDYFALMPYFMSLDRKRPE